MESEGWFFFSVRLWKILIPLDPVSAMAVSRLAAVGILLGIRFKAELCVKKVSKLSYSFMVPTPEVESIIPLFVHLGAWASWFVTFGRLCVPLSVLLARGTGVATQDAVSMCEGKSARYPYALYGSDEQIFSRQRHLPGCSLC